MIQKTKAVWTYPDGREKCTTAAAGRREYKRRAQVMAERQGGICPLCNRLLRVSTFDHQAGRGMGGGHRDDRIEVDGKPQNAAVCWQCNYTKGSKRMTY